MMEIKIGNTLIRCLRADITLEKADAVVNAANSLLAGGGGVDGAIHNAGGPEIMAECREAISRITTLPVGEAVSTTAGLLKARRVIHTVGPVWRGGNKGEAKLLESAYRKSLELCRQEGLRTVVMPAISAGIYRYPLAEAAKIAVSTVCDVARFTNAFDKLRFALFNDKTLAAFEAALGEEG